MANILLIQSIPVGTRGFKMRIGPSYPHVRRKRLQKWDSQRSNSTLAPIEEFLQ